MNSALYIFPLLAAVSARSNIPPSSGYNYNPPTISNLKPTIAENVFSGTSTSSLISEPSSSYLPGTTNIHGDRFTGIQEEFDSNRYQNQRSVYFFAAPDDEYNARFRIYVKSSSGRNAKVIFIKAPGHGGIVPDVITPPSQAEEKTLIYVLSKHQQHGGSVTIPSSFGVRQAKPEVHFIRYRNHQDVQSAVSQGLVGQRVGTTLQDLGNAQVFTRNLGWRGGDQTGITNPAIDIRYGSPTIDTRYGAPRGYVN